MDNLYLEYGYSSLNKANEELCGDRVEYKDDGEYMTLVLSDGLGSGVKANILATLTSKILCCLVSNNIDMQECIETIVQTLPVCKVRKSSIFYFFGCTYKQGKGFCLSLITPKQFFFTMASRVTYKELNIIIVTKKFMYPTWIWAKAMQFF